MKLLIGLHKNEYESIQPASVIAASKKYIEGNNDVFTFVTNNYERTGNIKDFITLKDIKLSYMNHKEYESKIYQQYRPNITSILHPLKTPFPCHSQYINLFIKF